MKYDVWYGRHGHQPVSSIGELDTVLDDAEQQHGDGGAPLVVTIIPVVDRAEVDELPGLEVGLGHPDRAFVFYSSADGHHTGYGIEPDVDEYPTNLGWDYSGQWTDYEPIKTRVTPATAREAARQYVATGKRPTHVQWTNGS